CKIALSLGCNPSMNCAITKASSEQVRQVWETTAPHSSGPFPTAAVLRHFSVQGVRARRVCAAGLPLPFRTVREMPALRHRPNRQAAAARQDRPDVLGISDLPGNAIRHGQVVSLPVLPAAIL